MSSAELHIAAPDALDSSVRDGFIDHISRGFATSKRFSDPDTPDLLPSPAVLPSLAGPNDVVQMLADYPVWTSVFASVVGLSLAAAKRLVEKSVDAAWDNRTAFLAHLKTLGTSTAASLGVWINNNNQTVIASVPVDGYGRNAGIELPHEAADIAWRIAMLARHAPALREELKIRRQYMRNKDQSVRVSVDDSDGSLMIYWSEGSKHFQKKIGP